MTDLHPDYSPSSRARAAQRWLPVPAEDEPAPVIFVPRDSSWRGSFHVGVDWRSRPTVVRLTGELDLATAPLVDQTFMALHATGRHDVTVRLSGLTFCGCAGLNSLVRAQAQLTSLGGRLVLTGLPTQLRRILRVLGLTDTFTIVPG